MGASNSTANGSSRNWTSLIHASATERADALAKDLGINCYSRNPCDRLIFRMDPAPPEVRAYLALSPEARKGTERPAWRTHNHRETDRVEACCDLFSWCWPISMPYAVVTVRALGLTVEQAQQQGLHLGPRLGDDTFVLDERGQPIALTPRHIAAMLGMDDDNVRRAIRVLEKRKVLRVIEHRVYLNPKPFLTAEEREKEVSTDLFLDLDPLESTNLKISKADRKLLARIPDRKVRTDLFLRLAKVHSDLLAEIKEVRARAKKAREEVWTDCPILIDQTAHSSCSLEGRQAQYPEVVGGELTEPPPACLPSPRIKELERALNPLFPEHLAPPFLEKVAQALGDWFSPSDRAFDRVRR